MSSEAKFKMSQESLDKIKEELQYLETVREKEVAEQIKEARSFGDLSENSEYDEAKTEQGKLYSKIAELKNIVDHVEVIANDNSVHSVTIGCTVHVECLEDGEVEEYTIVGSQEANPMEGRISDDSPFGKGLLGHAEGEVVSIEAPAGVIKYKINKIERR